MRTDDLGRLSRSEWKHRMLSSEKTKKVMRVTLWIIVLTLCVAALATMVLFVSLNSDMKMHRELANYFMESGVVDSEVQMLRIEAEIENKLGMTQLILMATAILILVSLAIGLGVNLIHKAQIKSKTYRHAYIDEVTGLPTKAKHRLEVDEKLRTMRREYAYVSVEVDNFTYIKEMYGYAYGNHILQRVAEGLKEVLLPDELLSHTSESRFGLLVQYDGDEELRRRLLDVFHKVGQIPPNEEVESVYTVSFTCGAYRIMHAGESAVRVRECANIAREEARRLFENNVEFYDEKLQQRRAEQEQFEYEMRQALEKNQFVVYMQPKYSTVKEEIVGAEALVRWEHPEKGLIYPNSFVPLFESNGFIVKVDYYILESVCKCIRNWLNEGVEPVVVSVNLSRVHLYNADLVERLVEITDRYRIPHNLIEFELTETVLFDELGQLINVMAKLKQAGFVLSMDDFGSGYSSLNMLKQLPVDILKLDKAFLDNFDTSDTGQKEKTIVSHIISMAKDLDMEVLAEGVESKSQKDFLLSAKCDMIQGYYYSRPMKLERFDMELRHARTKVNQA